MKNILKITFLGILSTPLFSSEFITIGTGGVTGTYYPTGGAICRFVNQYKKESTMDSDVLKYLADQYSNEESSYQAKDNDMLSHIKNIISMSSDETAKEVIKMRYFTEGNKVKTFKEIADHFGVSTQTVVNWHDKFISFLKNKLKSTSNLDIV
jgi:DNA-directed RNA polymerase sigma subunit (sigma70/sigma32)